MISSNIKLAYIVYTGGVDYFESMFAGLNQHRHINIISDVPSTMNFSKLERLIYKVHFSPRANALFRLPFKSMWNDKIFSDKIFKGQRKCFIFFMYYLKSEYRSFFQKLKLKYPDCILVAYFEDVVSSRDTKHGNRLDISMVKECFDLVYSYDPVDAERYEFIYHPTFMGKVEMDFDKKYASDVFFLGADKNRIETINMLANKLKDNLCSFYITKYYGNKMFEKVNIIRDNIPYREYLKYVYNSKCLLEIGQQNASGFTLRALEAIVYNKKILTNNTFLIESGIFNMSQIYYFDNINSINSDSFAEFIETPIESCSYDVSPLSFVKDIEQRLA